MASTMENLIKSGFDNIEPLAVKSVQRGYAVASSSNIIITIKGVNPDKCVVTLNGAYGVGSSSYSFAQALPALTSLSETSLTVHATTGAVINAYTAFSWQVIEFY